MARRRMITPSFFEDEEICTMNYQTRLFYIGLWVEADDAGIFRANPKLLCSKIFPYDNDITDEIVMDMMDKLKSKIYLYDNEGQKFGWLVNFDKYQSLTNPTPSRLPKPEGWTGKPARKSQAKKSKPTQLKINPPTKNQKPKSNHSETIKYFVGKWELKHHEKYKFQSGKDASIVQALVALYKPETLHGLIDLFFNIDDQWIKSTDYSLGVFSTQVNKLSVRMASIQEEKKKEKAKFKMR